MQIAGNSRTPLLPRNSRELNEAQRWSWLLRGTTVLAICLCVVVLVPRSSISTKDKNSTEPAYKPRQSQYELNYIELNSANGNGSLNYLVVGDWGRKGLYNQSELATQMGKIGDSLGIEFVVSAGDNFYDTGLTGSDDAAFTESFTNVYTASSLQTTWYSVLGNHDYMGDVLSQLSQELVDRDSRWFCRRTFQLHRSLCTQSSSVSACNASVDMFFFDTNPFIDAYWSNDTTQTFDWRGLAPREEQLQSQLEDLDKALQSSDATWKIVIGHHTIRSVGHHGDMIELVEQLLPILEKYEVDMYINGHDHNVQHIKRSDSNVHIFTSGGGSKAYSGLRDYTDEAGVQFVFDGQGFLAVSMTTGSTSLTFYNVFGEDLYTHVLQK